MVLSAFAMPLPAQSRPTANLDLGVVVETVSPGEKVSLPLTLVTSGEPQVTRVSVEVSFPSRLFTFVEVSNGAAADSAGVEISIQSRDAEDEEKILQIDVAASAPIPQGVLLNVVLEVAQHVRLDSDIRVKNLKQTALSADGQPLETYGIDGSITVLSPVSACFFYMH